MDSVTIKMLETWAVREHDVQKSFRRVKRADRIKLNRSAGRIRATFEKVEIGGKPFTIYVDVLTEGHFKKAIFEVPGTTDQHMLMAHRADRKLRALLALLPQILSKDPRAKDVVWMSDQNKAAA